MDEKKLQRKLAPIWRCGACHYAHPNKCTYLDREFADTTVPYLEVQEWCPLPDAPEEMPR